MSNLDEVVKEKANINKIEYLVWPIWKRTVIIYYMNKERKEKINREDKIVVVSFLNS